uniref:DDE Tnp4 domain-containing protein n=1 Tax=Brassica oleracea var. oleracea TaxID=109376 RepID=A0A0D3DGF9_BRAOL
MDSRNPSNPYSDSPSYSHLLHSQNFQYGSYPPSQNFGGGSEIPPFSSQAPEAPAQRENPSVASKERRQRENPDDEVVISAWLNTSKDVVVGNEQKSGTFWKRVAEYYASSPHAKASAIRQLAYGGAADSLDEYVRLAETTARKSLRKFTAGIICLFGDEYLRQPTQEDLQRLFYIREQRGFPGMIGSIDCMHWEWKNCPTAWKRMYSRGTEKPTIVLEVVASSDLWIWHAFFGATGTVNDLNILDRSPVFDDIINGIAPEVNFYVNGNPYHLAYYLTDGIYPKWATFIQSIRLPQSEKHSLFAKTQEAVRKDVERAFGVLQSRFVVVKNSSKLWDKDKIANIMKACIILHNMIVEDERSTYTQYNVREF